MLLKKYKYTFPEESEMTMLCRMVEANLAEISMDHSF